jgi:hydrogenase maturation protease
VVFDAVSSGQKPGTVFRFEVPGDAIAREVFSCSTHTLSLAEVIELAKTLHQLPPQLIVYGVEGFSFETGSGLSPEVKRGAQKIVEQVTQEFYSKITKG